MRASISAVLLLTCLAGCGDDEEGDRPRYRSNVSVDTDTGVSDLNEDDRAQVCASLNGFVNAQVDFGLVARAACLPGSILLSGDQDDCEARLGDCIDSFPDPISVTARFDDEQACVTGLSVCDDITVAQLEGCVNVNLDFVYSIIDSLSCGGLSDAERSDAQMAMDALSVCSNVDAACSDYVRVTGPY
jgi:hypothetical protein